MQDVEGVVSSRCRHAMMIYTCDANELVSVWVAQLIKGLTTKEFILRRLRCFPGRRNNIRLNLQLRPKRHLFADLDNAIDFRIVQEPLHMQDEDRRKGLNKDFADSLPW